MELAQNDRIAAILNLMASSEQISHLVFTESNGTVKKAQSSRLKRIYNYTTLQIQTTLIAAITPKFVQKKLSCKNIMKPSASQRGTLLSLLHQSKCS